MDIEPIPHPELKSWMFKRVEIPNKFPISRKYWDWSNNKYYVTNSIFSRIIKYTRAAKMPHVTFIIFSLYFKVFFKIFNRLEIIGKDKIPKEGSMFYVNHPGSLDTMILTTAVGKEVGCFIAWDNVMLTKLAEISMGYVNKDFIRKSDYYKQYGSFRDVLIEKMIQTVLKTNKYFAIWPGGGLDDNRYVRRGFSSVVRAYSVINSKKDVIPFQPVLIKGSECYHIAKNFRLRPRTQKITIEFLDPYYIPREWLKDPKLNKDGKTPREIIDYMMNLLAKANGQRFFAPNKGLEWRKQKFLEKQGKK